MKSQSSVRYSPSEANCGRPLSACTASLNPNAVLYHITLASLLRKPLKTNAWFPLQLRYNVRPQARKNSGPQSILPNTRGGNVTPSTESDVNKFLNSIELPGIGRSIADVGRVLTANQADGNIDAKIELGFPAKSRHEQFRAHIAAAIAKNRGG